MSNAEEPAPVPKTENSELESFSDSSPEPDDPNFIHEEVTQVQKRKGGRKPIYATSEERKQRNRQAQAAFRERRTEYIKQLEATIKHHEETLQSLQQSHRSAADECLMLRYKNSLLERILLEKGIDVQAELKSKTEASHLPPNHAPPAAIHQPTPAQRAVINRHGQARRSVSNIASKPAFAQPSPTSAITKPSPRLQPTPPSQVMSPTATKSPVGLIQGGMTSPGVDLQAQRQQQPPRRAQHPPPQRPSISTSVTGLQVQHSVSTSRSGPASNEMASSTSSQTSYYPSPFQTHYEQLEQEYDAHADMLDDQEPSDNSATGPSPYPNQFNAPLSRSHPLPHSQPPLLPPMQSMQQMPPIQPAPQMQPPPASQVAELNNPALGDVNQSFDPFDPMLDADPFGLTASMHFPTQFSFQESSMRQ